MIRFTCRCKNVLQTPDDQAGLTVQCDKCGLLVDVPLLSDMRSLEKDGTYKINEVNTAKPNLAELQRIYYPGHKLPDGSEIDMRGTVAPMPSSQPLGLVPEPDASARQRPKYDPDTGELVQPLDVSTPQASPPPARMAEAHRVIDYNISPDVLEGSPHGLGVFAALFAPLNVIVMFIIFGCHLFLMMSLIVTFGLIAFAHSVFAGLMTIPIPFAVLVFITSHYAAVHEDIALAEKDELPRPLRNVNPWDDFLSPFGRTMLALILCYWPLAGILVANFQAAMSGAAKLPFPVAGPWLLGLFVLGSILFPAVFMTICTSGTLLNLAPQRLLGTMYQVGWIYPLLVILWIAATFTYVAGFIGTIVGTMVAFSFSSVPILARAFVTYPVLMLGIYLAHAFCWQLGLTYRLRHMQFPWVAQRHEHKKEKLTRPLHPILSAAEAQAQARAARRPRTIR